MEITVDLILVIASSTVLLFAVLYIIYYFKNLNRVEIKDKVSNENNYSGANFNAEYKFDGKYKKNEYITSGKIIFFVLLFLGFLYFQYYQDGFNYSNRSRSFGGFGGSSTPGVEDISLSNITLFGAAANSLSGKTSGNRNNYRNSKNSRGFGKTRNRTRGSIRGSGSSFRGRSYGGGGK